MAKNDVVKREAISIKGEKVDFDLLSVKSQISETPKTDEVVKRERFIDKKRRRGTRKIDTMLTEQSDNKRYAENMIEAQRRARLENPQTTEVENNVDADVDDESKTPKTSTRRIRG